MINTQQFVNDLETALKPFEGTKFSSIGDMCKFRQVLDKALSKFGNSQPKGLRISGKLEILSKTTLRYSVVTQSNSDVFYPDWSMVLKYNKDFDVFTRGKRNRIMRYKVAPIDRTDAMICALGYLYGKDFWKDSLKHVFSAIKYINGKVIMSHDQRDLVDKVRILIWKSGTLSFVRDNLINLANNGIYYAKKMIPIDTKSLTNTDEIFKKMKERDEHYGEVKTVKIKTCKETSCKFCVKWMSMRNNGNTNLAVASCPILGRKTRSSFSCGNFKHF